MSFEKRGLWGDAPFAGNSFVPIPFVKSLKISVEACRKYDVRPGFYYLLSWDKQNQTTLSPRDYEDFCTGQIGELLKGYGPITELWLDIPWDMGPDTDWDFELYEAAAIR